MDDIVNNGENRQRRIGSARRRSRSHRSSTLLATVGLLVASAAAGFAAPSAGAANPAPSPSTEVGSIPVVPPGAHAKGIVADSTPVHLVVTLRPRDPAALRSAVAAVSTPGSPLYRKYFSTTTFGALFGASDEQITEVRSGLRAVGLTPGAVSTNRLAIDVDATASQVASALHTPLHSFETAQGVTAYANTTAPTLPSSIAGNVQAVLGLDTFPAAKPGSRASSRAHVGSSSTAGAAKAGTTSVAAGVPVACSAAANAAAGYGSAVPADYLNAYSASSLVSAGHSGGGQNLAIMSLQKMNTSDVNTFRQCFGSTGTVTSTQVDGGAVASDGTDEATLDVETMLGLAPSAHISFYEAPNTDAGWYDGLSAIVGANSAKAISVSWGLCEAAMYDAPVDASDGYLIDAEFDLLAQGALQGQTFFASTGDTGSAGCYDPSSSSPYTGIGVSDPASQPYATAVGGTSLSSTTAPPTETVWNNSHGASGGGVSNYWFQPDYQDGITDGYDSDGNVCGNPGSYCRTVPDVSASADPANHGLTLYIGGRWTPFGGTSLAAPTWASLVADMNSSCPATNGFGMLNNTLYGLPSSDFNDVTSGNNDFKSFNGGKYAAKPGYDLATGLGTPIVSRLTGSLCAHTSTITPNESFILAAYVDFTGSLPLEDSSDPLDYWDGQLANGAPRTTLIDALANSNAWVAHIVEDFYQDTLGRAPDAGGLQYWETIIEQHRMSVAQVAAQFYSSSEYYRRDNDNATTWVRDLYTKLLDRAPDSGVSYWVSQVGTRGRDWVAYSFYQSSESRRDRVAALYTQLLHRGTDPGGLAYWAGVIQTHGDVALAESLASSSEYYRLAATRFLAHDT